MKKISILLCAMAILAASSAYAGQQGHYLPGVMDIRDHVLPPKEGLYYVQYDLYYHSDSYYDNNGEKLKNLSANKSISFNGYNLDVTADVDVETRVDNVTIMPMLIYVTGWKLLGADVGVVIAPSFGYMDVKLKANADITATLQPIGLQGHWKASAEEEQDNFGFGDLYAQPVFLDWRGEKYDIALGYGFYAPTGAYSEDRIANMGMGFWSHEIMLGGMYYLDKYHMTALMFNANYEINSKKYDMNLTPGQDVIIEYGISHYLTPQLEVGVTGSNIWQVTDSWGTDARNKEELYYIFGVGAQLSYWIIKDKMYLSGKYNYQYAAQNTYGGQLFVLNLIYVF